MRSSRVIALERLEDSRIALTKLGRATVSASDAIEHLTATLKASFIKEMNLKTPKSRKWFQRRLWKIFRRALER